MLFGYKCRTCGQTYESKRNVNPLGPCTTPDCDGQMTRSYSIALKPALREHWNSTVNAPVSDAKQFARLLKERGEEYTEKTGIVTNYVPVDYQDTAACRVTGEGLDETNRQRVASGLTPIRIP